MIYSRKDFSKLCGFKASNELSVYVQRGKVILTPDKKVDIRVAENAEFLEERKKKGATIEIEIKEKKFSKEDLKKLERSEKHQELNTRIKTLEVEKSVEEINLLRIKKQKQEGILIPTDLVKQLFAQHFRSITVSFQQGAENLIIEISKKKS